ncbi:MAG: BMP family protein [Rhizobiales bacterium]|nr:BMP family protein [Hyphomicrobiales bacterium]
MAILAGMTYQALADDFRVAAVLPGVVTDKSFNQQVFEGLKASEKLGGVEIAYTEKVTQAEQVEVMSDYARRGYNLIVGAGGEYVDAAKRIRSQFPDVSVVVLNGAETENVTTLMFEHEQFAYLVGLVAGRVSKNGTLAALTAQPIPAFDRVVKGFTTGLHVSHPEGKVLTTLTNDWSDVAKAKAASVNLISQGADVLLPYLDGAYLGVVQAADEKGVYVVGVAQDLAVDDPKANLFSTIQDYGGMVSWSVAKAKAGELEAKRYDFGVGSFPNEMGPFNDVVPQNVRDEVKAAVEDLKAGKVTFK